MLFGVASIGRLFLFSRQAGSTRQALFAAALFTFSYHHIWFSQNARGYSGLLFWALLSSYFLIRALREDRPGLWLAYTATASLGIYTHITMLFVIAGQGFDLHQFWVRRRDAWPRTLGRRAGLGLGFCGTALATFVLHSIVLPQIRSGMQKTVSVVEAWNNPSGPPWRFSAACRSVSPEAPRRSRPWSSSRLESGVSPEENSPY